MRIALLPLLTTALLQGCIIMDLDDHGDGWDDPWRDDDGWSDDTGWDDDDWGDDTGSDDDTADEPALDAGLAFHPAQAAQGDTLIGYVTADVDLANVVEVKLFGDVEVGAIDPTADRIVVSFDVDPGARLGAVDLLVTFDDGSAAWLDDALTIFDDGAPDPAPGDDPCDE